MATLLSALARRRALRQTIAAAGVSGGIGWRRS